MEKTAKIPGKATIFFGKAASEVFVVTEGDRTVIRGYAAKFNTVSEDLGGFRTIIAPGAFDRVIGQSDTRLLINHDPNLLMGRTSTGTLKLSLDATGLKFEGYPPMSNLAAHYAEMINRGDLDGCSFSCDIDVDLDRWDWSGEMPIRTIQSVSHLYDVGPVTFPAFSDTDVSVSRFALDAAREAARRAESDRLEAAACRRRRAIVLSQRVSLGI